MLNIFYNCFSILIGLILIYFGISSLKKNKKALGIISLIHSILFLGFGIGGFFLPEEYQHITILSLLAFCITMVICLVILKDKKNTTK